MSVQENKALARRVFEEIWSQGKLEVAEELLSPDFEGHPPSALGEAFKGPGGAKEFIGRLRRAFPDLTFSVEDMVAQGELVATRWTASGTHEGEFMGVEPTERETTFPGMTFLRFEDDRIVEGWTQMDAMALMREIGAAPALARA